MKKLLLATCLCSLCLLACTASAAAKTPTLKSLAKSVTALQKQVSSLSSKLTLANATITSQGATISTLTSQLSTDQGTIATLSGDVARTTLRLNNAASLLAIAPYVSLSTAPMNGVAGPNIVFRGVNLHVMSATSEQDTSGLGNLIVGWDDMPLSLFFSGYRSGSNDLICGDGNAFPADGVFLAGAANIASEFGASVSGGFNNTASGLYASVSGGYANTASGLYASVSGGNGNTASDEAASVSGGSTNQATADGTSISGGSGVTVNVPDGWSAGGSFHDP